METLEDELDDKENPITIESIRDKLSVKFDRRNEQSGLINSIQDEKLLYIKSQYKGTCMTCRKYGHNVKDWCHKEGANKTLEENYAIFFKKLNLNLRHQALHNKTACKTGI